MRMRREFYLLLAVGLLLLVLTMELLAYMPTKAEASLEVLDVEVEGPLLTVRYRLRAGDLPIDVQLVFVLRNGTPVDRPIYVYYDSEYQMSCSNPWTVKWFVDRLVRELSKRGYKGPVSVVNATGLKVLLTDLDAALGKVLIVPTGALPDTVFTKEYNLLKPWVKAGGVVFWLAGYFLYYSAKRTDEPLNWQDPWHPRDEGADEFFGVEHSMKLTRYYVVADMPTYYSRALCLRYRFLYRNIGLSTLYAMGGRALGYIYELEDGTAVPSISYVPVGKGAVVLFGGVLEPSEAITAAASDVAQILALGILDAEVAGFETYSLRPGEVVEGTAQLLPGGRYEALWIYMFSLGDITGLFKAVEVKLSDYVIRPTRATVLRGLCETMLGED